MAIRDSNTLGPAKDVGPNGSEAEVSDNGQDEAAEFEAFLRSAPLPDPETLQALNAAHLEFLDELDREFGPVPKEVQERARQLYSELKANT